MIPNRDPASPEFASNVSLKRMAGIGVLDQGIGPGSKSYKGSSNTHFIENVKKNYTENEKSNKV